MSADSQIRFEQYENVAGEFTGFQPTWKKSERGNLRRKSRRKSLAALILFCIFIFNLCVRVISPLRARIAKSVKKIVITGKVYVVMKARRDPSHTWCKRPKQTVPKWLKMKPKRPVDSRPWLTITHCKTSVE